jgi:hypothetical protein
MAELVKSLRLNQTHMAGLVQSRRLNLVQSQRLNQAQSALSNWPIFYNPASGREICNF